MIKHIRKGFKIKIENYPLLVDKGGGWGPQRWISNVGGGGVTVGG